MRSRKASPNRLVCVVCGGGGKRGGGGVVTFGESRSSRNDSPRWVSDLKCMQNVLL
jgi:hypothetical protein